MKKDENCNTCQMPLELHYVCMGCDRGEDECDCVPSVEEAKKVVV